MRSVASKVVDSVDILAGLVTDYVPALKPLLDEAYDSEVLEAFTAVLGLAYPSGQLLERIKALGGSRPLSTPPS